MSEDVDEDELGGAVVAQRKAGFACRSENSEVECFAAARELLSYMPQSNREKPVRVSSNDKPDRTDASLFDVVPSNPAQAYDIHKIIEKVFDIRKDGKKNYFEVFRSLRAISLPVSPVSMAIP